MLWSEMSDVKSTKLTIREDRATALSSSAHGSNMDAIGFNLTFLALRNPKLAVEILRLYALAHAVDEDYPQAPDEDYALFADEITKIAKEESDN
jgi:hypothetical protein